MVKGGTIHHRPIGENVNITNGQQYSFGLDCGGNYSLRIYGVADAYGGGKFLDNTGTPINNDLDLWFKIAVNGGVNAVPTLSEYGKAAFIMLLIFFSLIAIRKKNRVSDPL
jgi:hypothetical protein